MLLLSISLLSILAGVRCRMAEEPMPVSKQEPPASTVNESLSIETYESFSSPGCFHANRSHCNETQLCRNMTDHGMLCCDIDADSFKEYISPDRIAGLKWLHVINATMSNLDISAAVFRRLTSISFTDGNITEISGEIKRLASIECLNFTNNGILNITERGLATIYLKVLDISYNNITLIPRLGKGKDIYLDLKGNNKTFCKSVLETFKEHKENLKFINFNSTFCTASKTFDWFNTSELIPIQQVEMAMEVSEHCGLVGLEANNCTCQPVRFDMVAGKSPTISVGVNCSHRHLKELPEKLPPNTVELYVSYNNITSLKPISDHPSYDHLRRLYADNNNIQSILDLEGTKFMDNFIVLSLESNKLKTIPTYILSDSFDRNWNPRQVLLANNYLNCDCETTRQIKLWLLSKPTNIPDFNHVMCENIKDPLILLHESNVCPKIKNFKDYIYYVIGIEVALLFGLIAKVLYDYWVYKTAGYLPWPASEMPKLPCDWLCE